MSRKVLKCLANSPDGLPPGCWPGHARQRRAVAPWLLEANRPRRPAPMPWQRCAGCSAAGQFCTLQGASGREASEFPAGRRHLCFSSEKHGCMRRGCFRLALASRGQVDAHALTCPVSPTPEVSEARRSKRVVSAAMSAPGYGVRSAWADRSPSGPTPTGAPASPLGSRAADAMAAKRASELQDGCCCLGGAELDGTDGEDGDGAAWHTRDGRAFGGEAQRRGGWRAGAGRVEAELSRNAVKRRTERDECRRWPCSPL
jgi:hypothetical protein